MHADELDEMSTALAKIVVAVLATKVFVFIVVVPLDLDVAGEICAEQSPLLKSVTTAGSLKLKVIAGFRERPGDCVVMAAEDMDGTMLSLV